MFKTKKYWQIPLIIILCLIVFPLFPTDQLRAAPNVVMTPYTLTDGSTKELTKENSFHFISDGNQLVQLNIPQNGAVSIDLSVEKAGIIVVEIYTKSDASDMPSYVKAQCSVGSNNTGNVFHYFSKGTYYLRFPANAYQADMQLYTCKNVTLKNGSVVAAYCDYVHENIYTFKAEYNGYINISEKSLINKEGSIRAVLCDKNGKKITEQAIFSQVQNNQITYAVKKGTTYKLKIKALNINDTPCYQIKLTHSSVNEKSGSSKKKAVAVKFGNKVSGTVYAEDSVSKEDWYQIKNKKKQQLLLNYSGSITSGSLIFDVYDKNGKKLDSYTVISNIGESHENLMHNAKGGTTIVAGTYYLKVTKSAKTATGIYSFSLSGI